MNISNEQIVKLIEENLNYFYKKSTFHDDFLGNVVGNVKWVLANNVDWPDCIFQFNLDEINVDSEIKKIRNQINIEKMPNGWTVGPLSTPHDLGNHLKRNGFKKGYQQSGMAVDLQNLANFSQILDIQIVKGDLYLQEWINCVSEVFNGIKINKSLIKFLQEDKRFTFYVGLENHKIKSALMLVVFPERVAGLHAVSTLPKYRGRGFAMNISGKALKDAFQTGCKIGVLQASELGEKVYTKLGFKKYCDIFSYELDI